MEEAVLNNWEKIKEDARSKFSLRYLKIDGCSFKQIHPNWRIGAGDALTVIKASINVRLPTQRYPINSNKTASNAMETHVHYVVMKKPSVIFY